MSRRPTFDFVLPRPPGEPESEPPTEGQLRRIEQLLEVRFPVERDTKHRAYRAGVDLAKLRTTREASAVIKFLQETAHLVDDYDERPSWERRVYARPVPPPPPSFSLPLPPPNFGVPPPPPPPPPSPMTPKPEPIETKSRDWWSPDLGPRWLPRALVRVAQERAWYVRQQLAGTLAELGRSVSTYRAGPAGSHTDRDLDRFDRFGHLDPIQYEPF